MANKGLVLVTGANGYVAARTVEAFLQAGYAVRGTVRSASSGKSVTDALPEYADRLEMVLVPDITLPGAFDEAVKGVDAVAHLAAPVSMHFTDPAPVLKGAIDGILRALESAHKEPTVKSFIFMSSIAAVLHHLERPEDIVFDESDWNSEAEDLLAQLGKDAPGPVIYSASKTAAEKALWKFRDEQHPAFSVTAIQPVFISGPPLVLPSSLDALQKDTTYRCPPDVYTGKALSESGVGGGLDGYVDVRDVARIVVFGVEHPDKANNQRFIASSAWAPPQAVADILREAYPGRKGIIQEGTPREGYTPGTFAFPKKMAVDGSKAVQVTGKEYIPFEKTVLDTVEKLMPLLG